MATSLTAIECVSFTRRYNATTTIGPLSLTVPTGTCHGLIGANGAGKTSLMRCLLGLDVPTSGSVSVRGAAPRLGQPVPGVAGMVEEPSFFGWLDGADNLRAAFPHRRLDVTEMRAVLAEVGLADAGRRAVRRYSQGMRQRLGIARVLLADAAVLVLDEPTNGLDPVGIRWMRELVRGLTREGRTVLFSSHLLHEVQATCDTFTMLDHGSLVAAGDTSETAGFASLEDLYLDRVLRGPKPGSS